MYQQYLNQAKAALDYLSSDELKELLNDDEKLEERVNDVVRKKKFLIVDSHITANKDLMAK